MIQTHLVSSVKCFELTMRRNILWPSINFRKSDEMSRQFRNFKPSQKVLSVLYFGGKHMPVTENKNDNYMFDQRFYSF